MCQLNTSDNTLSHVQVAQDSWSLHRQQISYGSTSEQILYPPPPLPLHNCSTEFHFPTEVALPFSSPQTSLPPPATVFGYQSTEYVEYFNPPSLSTVPLSHFDDITSERMLGYGAPSIVVRDVASLSLSLSLPPPPPLPVDKLRMCVCVAILVITTAN